MMRPPGLRRLKNQIRKAAGYKCQRCAMTNESHFRLMNKQLHVHRKVPGSEYTVEGCEVLCEDCHKTAHGHQNGFAVGESPRFTGILRREWKGPK